MKRHRHVSPLGTIYAGPDFIFDRVLAHVRVHVTQETVTTADLAASLRDLRADIDQILDAYEDCS